jgi:hypothetical protein
MRQVTQPRKGTWTGRKEFSVFLIKVSYKDLSSSRSLCLSRSLSSYSLIFLLGLKVGEVFFAPVDQYMSEGCRSKGPQGCANKKRMKKRNKADILFFFPFFQTCWTRQCSVEVNCWELWRMFGDSSIPLSSRKNKQPHV